jgi:hypothetical protein
MLIACRQQGGDVVLAGQMLKRLEDEGKIVESIFVSAVIYREIEFVLQETKALDDMGVLFTTRSKKTKTKGKETTKHPKARKNMQKTRYVFNHEIETKPQYLENFKPNDQVVEARLLGLSEMARMPFIDGEQSTDRWGSTL